MPGIAIEIKGIDQLRAKLARLPKAAVSAFEDALVKEAQGIMDHAQETVPVRTGRLRSSGRVTATKEALKAIITIAYDAPYAIYPHEKTHWADGRRYAPYHWLVKAAERANKGMAGRLLRYTRRALKGTVYAR